MNKSASLNYKLIHFSSSQVWTFRMDTTSQEKKPLSPAIICGVLQIQSTKFSLENIDWLQFLSSFSSSIHFLRSCIDSLTNSTVLPQWYFFYDSYIVCETLSLHSLYIFFREFYKKKTWPPKKKHVHHLIEQKSKWRERKKIKISFAIFLWFLPNVTWTKHSELFPKELYVIVSSARFSTDELRGEKFWNFIFTTEVP